MIDQALGWLDERLGVSKSGKKFLDKIFPDHWSFMLGEIALYSFVVLVLTGVFLTLYYVPSTKEVIYHGRYLPLVGKRMSEAYASTLHISFGVRVGLLMRQTHHWAADVFVAAIAVHMIRVFFTGAYRKPRELNWIIGVTLLMLAIVNGFIGYSLPDDLISGTGIRIAFSITESIPLVGSYLAFFLFGGNYPGTAIIPRFFILHVLILPAIIAVLIGAHMGLLIRHKHTQFPGPGRSEDNVVGSPLWPNFAAKTTGFQLIVFGVLFALGGLIQINPIWQFGPYLPYKVSYAVQPDWYMGWLDGALRIMPSWEFAGFGHTIPFEVFLPGVVLPLVTTLFFFAWPFIEERFTGDHAPHHLLDRPRDRPLRTSFGAAVLAFYVVLFGASSTDVIANFFHITLNTVLWSFRFLVVIVPIVVGVITNRICHELAGTAQPREARPRRMPNVIVRSDEGGYETYPVSPYPEDEAIELEPEPVPVNVDQDATA
ncbi:MAG: cytochrome bc complex cytochrome b subunit [Actinobacteria bacterium]|jgi:ubiquinol-cytochrome c reductase cytochrome b subunit|nr:cytochrome bc complex cytochrome b subunit [Actinomycetota bacterium]MCL6094691.1 cytochrome bc complex cytochrome b subunit [Actinomycetota bacterium]